MLKVEIIAIETDQDHAHLFLNALPTCSPADIMAKIKGVTSKRPREEFKHLAHLPSLWTRSYFVSTAGNVSSETINRYVEQQKTGGSKNIRVKCDCCRTEQFIKDFKFDKYFGYIR
ncbi:hypothetical protein GCM10010912_47930 [Paenibacillus albidus]|uniref:Transposase IS200-like domain-containing protein n=1 Tax=Paenibacillus albidus TaxID=2041023 RepID=A0A917FS97_9BACL|nr:hypothetical protein GCM10010912_47930 [Paenibacillus albidus]